MTDATGMLQHATHTIPNFAEGYCTDDNARALLPAAAGVGHSVVHQRFSMIRSRMPLRARATRAIFAGSTPASSNASAGAWMLRLASTRLASSSASFGASSRWISRACS